MKIEVLRSHICSRTGLALLYSTSLISILILLPGVARGQVFMASRPTPDVTLGLLLVRANVSKDSTQPTVELVWNLRASSSRTGSENRQDFYVLWPGQVSGLEWRQRPDASLTRFVEERGLSVLDAGRLSLESAGNGQRAEPGGAPFVVFALLSQSQKRSTVSRPASLIRIPWHESFAGGVGEVYLRFGAPDLIRPKTSWLEGVYSGRHYSAVMGFYDVRQHPGASLLYSQFKDRTLRLADGALSEVQVTFTPASRLRIDEVRPTSAIRRPTGDDTAVISVPLDSSGASKASLLEVDYWYFNAIQAILVTVALFALTQLGIPVLRTGLAKMAGSIQIQRVNRNAEHILGSVVSERVLSSFQLGETTYDCNRARSVAVS